MPDLFRHPPIREGIPCGLVDPRNESGVTSGYPFPPYNASSLSP